MFYPSRFCGYMTTLNTTDYFIQHLVKYAFENTPNLPEETKPQKKRYLKDMLKVLFKAKNNKEALTLKELFRITSLNAEPNLREIFIPIHCLFKTFSLTDLKTELTQQEIALMQFFADIFERGTSKEEYSDHLYLNNPPEQKKLRENFDKQFDMTKTKVKAWKASYSTFIKNKQKLRMNK